MEGLNAAGAAGLEYVLSGVEGWGRSLAPAPDAAVAQAKRAARAGVGLDTVLRRYIAGHAVVEDFIVWEVERNHMPIAGGALRATLQAIAILVDRLISAVSGAYSQEAERIAGGERSHGLLLSSRRKPTAADINHAVASPRRARAAGGRPERIVAAMTEVVAEQGYAHTTVRLVSARAGVSTRTFYEEFESLRECFIAVLDLGMEQAGEVIANTFAGEAPLRDRARSTLAALLVFLDSTPQLTRVWFAPV